MIKYATAIRTGTASTEAILRRFTRSASHPIYQAMLEVGRAQRTIFVARYVRNREPALVHINTLLLQDVVAEEACAVPASSLRSDLNSDARQIHILTQ